MRNVFVYAIAILALGCGGTPATGDDGGPRMDAHVETDAHVDIDAQVEPDAQVEVDAQVEADAFVPPDADPDVDSSVPDDGGALEDAARVCMIGQTCGDSQPCPDGAEFVCYGFGEQGFCAPITPQCGGFAGWLCTGGRTCIRAGGSSLGYCATAEEMDCICTNAAMNGVTTDGCPDTGGGR